jgi:pimeloyl-ACP methyl ester carboxylesterase
MARSWHRVVSELEAQGHEALPVDLPGDDPDAGLPEYVDLVLQAVDGDPDVTLVAASLGGFTAPVVASRTPTARIVLVNAMVPLPRETPGAWWANTGAVEARTAAARGGGYPTEFDDEHYFLHDVPVEVAASMLPHLRPESDITFTQPCDMARWPEVPTRVLAGRDDRFFPFDFQRRVARERLDLEVEVVPGGHLVALSQPRPLVDALLREAPTP